MGRAPNSSITQPVETVQRAKFKRIQQFAHLLGSVLMLHRHQGIDVIAQLPKLSEMAADELIAINEDRPAQVVLHIGTRKRLKENSVLRLVSRGRLNTYPCWRGSFRVITKDNHNL
jgi:hypothetical protein